MKARDILRFSLLNAFRGRLRTALTVFAAAVSVAATILVFAVGMFAQNAVSEQLDALGISGVSVYPKKVAADGGLRLDASDAVTVMNEVEGVDNALAVVIRYGSYTMKNWQGNAVIFGTGAGLGDLLDVEMLYGRFCDESDLRGSANVVVVDEEFAETVYGRSNIVGKTMTLTAGSSREFTVVGVISSQNGGMLPLLGDALPHFFYVPISTLSGMCGKDGADQLLIGSDDPAAIGDVIALLERVHAAPNSLRSEDISGLREDINGVTRSVGLFITAVGGISVLIAGIGIMNTMLSTAAERRREVGIYMSLGARRRDIVLGFIVEAGVISTLGAAVGAAAAYAALYVAGRVFSLDLAPKLLYIAAAVTVAACCGALFGVLPAVRASKIDPIEALREI